jgi:hypothetical protein
MSRTRAPHSRRLVLAAALLALAGCARPTLQLRSPPSLSLRLPNPPAIPEGSLEERSTGGAADARRVTSTRATGGVREQTVLMVLDGDPSLRAAALDLLPTTLVAARLTRVLLPPAMESLTGSVERGATGERTTLSGPAERLLVMGASTPVDAVLRVEVQRASDVIERTRQIVIPAEALQRYTLAVRQYREALQQAQRQHSAAAAYPAEAEAAVQTYQREGGRFDDDESRSRMEDARSFVALHTQLGAQLREALATPPPDADAVLREAARRNSSNRTRTPGVRLRAILSDLRAGETFWIDDVRANGDDVPALQQAFATLVQDLTAP